MYGCLWILVVVAFLDSISPCGGTYSVVEPSCSPDQTTCEFYLVLAPSTTMFLHAYDDDATPAPVVVSSDGQFYKRDMHNCSSLELLTEEEKKYLIAGDGYHKNVVLFNGSLPGPPIIVFEGQQVVVHLKNELVSEATSVHFHGILQHNTPWMDGAGGVSHCPINPGETFTYRFFALPVGTHWYHSHSGTQRTMGAYGTLIVLPHPDDTTWEERHRGEDTLPEFAKEYHLQVSDWFAKDSNEILTLVRTESISYFDGFDIERENCYSSTKSPDGFDCGVIPFRSGLINGKGRRYGEQDNVERPVPLEVFEVEKGSRYRFRVICSSMSFGFRVSIDGHELHVISSDGRDVRTRVVESVIVTTGERYDFWIEANDNQEIGAYWIRAETLEYFHQNGQTMKPHHTEAILRYKGYTGNDPTSSRRQCTAEHVCDILNCPYKYHGSDRNLSCIPLTDLKRPIPTKPHPVPEGSKFKEHFLNLHFAYTNRWVSTINGIRHIPPTAPPQIYPSESEQHLTTCDLEQCHKETCQCTNKLDIEIGQVFQLVFIVTSVQRHIGNFLNGISHTVHLHGYSLQVLKIGYPSYNDSGYFEANNPDFECIEGSDTCNSVRWRDLSWTQDLPGAVMEDPIEKDTVAVPVGGYVVVRAVADNPGYWYLHCHTEFHAEAGMAMIVQVGNVSEMNATPQHMRKCGNTIFPMEEFLSRVNNPVSPDSTDQPKDDGLLKTLQWLAFSIGSLCLFLFATIVYLLCKHYLIKLDKDHNEYTLIST